MSSLLQHLPSDEQLTTAVAAGDRAAFEELYRRYAGPLASYGARVLRDRSRGEDVAQTSLMRAYDALQRGTEPLRVKPWLYKIALNTALELKAKNGDVLSSDGVEPADTSSDFRAARADIVSGVRDLPERQQKVFVLREIKGLPVSEVARRLELTNQQVEQALFAARNRLAEVLVFGERASCETLRTLDRSQLTRYERRALKSHLRACPSCRRNGGAGLSALGFWLRDAWAWLIGGGASAAKLGAVAVTATVVGGAPVVAPAVANRVLRHDAKPTQARPVDARPPAQIDRRARIFDAPIGQPRRRAIAPASPVNEELAPAEAIPEESPSPAPGQARPEAPESLPSPPPSAEPPATVERELVAEENVDSSDIPVAEEPVSDQGVVEEPAQTPRAEEVPVDEAPVEPASEDAAVNASPEDVRADDGTPNP